MDRQVNIQLIQYRSVRNWDPRVGDIIIKHGWWTRTKWFGVVNFINPDGSLSIIKDGMMRLLVTTPLDAMRDKSIELSPDHIRRASSGSYAIMQQDPNTNMAVWYV